MNWKRVLKGKVSFHYHKWRKWDYIGTYRMWSGRLIYLGISKFCLHIDCRINWLEDMAIGTVR